MSKLLLNLRHVPDDEADDVRAMLDGAGIAYYETKPSAWGISAGGIYQGERSARARAAYAAARRDGTAETFWTVLRAEPGRVFLVALGIGFLLALVALPVLLLRG